MAEITANCPRCNAKYTTFTVASEIKIAKNYNWQNVYEAFCICRACNKSTTFVITEVDISSSQYIGKFERPSNVTLSLNKFVRIERYISTSDRISTSPPEHLPSSINEAFIEGAKCFDIGCFNASAAMFRLCLDIATRQLLPPDGSSEPAAKIRRSLGLRINWLLEKDILPKALSEISTCIKEDGNDGAHEGNLTKQDAEDIQDFTYLLLERLYTEPQRLRLAVERRNSRREESSKN